MNIHKIIKKISNFIKINKVRSNRSKQILNNVKNSTYIKKRKSFVIKNNHLERLKILWNNSRNYYIIIFIVLLLITLYIILWPSFKIKYIEIIRQDDITNMSISYKSLDNYRWKSIFTADKNEILKNLRNYQQNIHEISLNIELPNTLKIIVDSYKWMFNTTINDKTFIITENWTLIPVAYSTDLYELIIKNKFDKGKFYDYKQILNPEYINKIFSTKKSLEENLVNIKIKNVIYYVIERELHIEITNGTRIIFDLDSDTKNQIEKLAVFNKEQSDIGKISIIYIDLRINNKIFYCTKENEYQCKINIKSIYSE